MYPTLEELKSFEVGTNGLYIVSFSRTEFNILGAGRKFFPAQDVSYDYLKNQFYDISIGDVSIPLVSGVSYPSTMTLSYLDSYKEDIFKGLKNWVLNTTVYKTGRIPRDYMKDTEKVRIQYYDQDGSGGLTIVSEDSFNVFPPVELMKSASQGITMKEGSLTFNIAGNLNFK